MDSTPKQKTPTLLWDAPSRTAEAKTKFTEIGECMYQSKLIGGSGQAEAMTCDCHEAWDPQKKHNIACGDDMCINRATSVECVNGTGPCGEACRNQRFQRKEYAAVTVVSTDKKGYGLRADDDIPAYAFIYEYIGEVIDEKTFRKRMVDYDARNFKHFYFMMLQKDAFIDATVKGSLARFVNHSCNPNAYVDKWVVGDKLRMGLFAKRTIRGGEEITFDYNVDRYGAQAQPCYCGEPNCIRFMGGKTQTDATLLPDGVSEALGIQEQEKQWVRDNRSLLKKKDEAMVNSFIAEAEVAALDDLEVSKVMSMLMKTDNVVFLKRLVERIYLTDSEPINLSIVKMHGYKALSTVLKQHADDDEIVSMILQILAKWPRITRNKISSSQIEDVVRAINKKSTNTEIQELSNSLLQEWSQLQMAYRIPKRENNRTDSPSAYGRNPRSRSPEKKEKDAEEAPVKVEPDPDALPLGWEAGVDQNTGAVYYFNRMTQESAWEKPAMPQPAAPKPKAVTPSVTTSAKSSPAPKNYHEERLTKLEEERLRKEREEQFNEMQQKQKHLQDLILQSQKQSEEKKLQEERLKKEVQEKKEREREKRSKAKSKEKQKPKSTSPEQAWIFAFGKVVPNFIKKFEAEIGRDNIKGCAREIVRGLAEKEIKKNASKRPPEEFENAKMKKIKDYSRAFMEKFLVKYRSKHKRGHRDEENGGVKRVKT